MIELPSSNNSLLPSSKQFNNTPEPVKKFIEFLPSVIKNYVIKVGDAIEVPYEIPVMGLLACTSICIGKDIILKEGHRRTYANMYSLIIGEPGLGKSPAVEHMLEPLREKDKMLHEQYQNDLDELHTQKDNAKTKAEKAKIESKIKMLTRHKNIIDDETLENIAIRMLNAPKGLLWSTDEFSSLIKKQYNGSSVTDYLVKAYSNQTWDIGRKTQEDIHVPVTYLSTISTTQVATAERFLLTPELQGNGFISRHLISVVLPDDERIPELNPPMIHEKDVEEYKEVMLSLYNYTRKFPNKLILSDEAKITLSHIEFLHKVKRQNESSSVFKGFHGKLGERIRKVAINLHMLQCTEAQLKGKQIQMNIIPEKVISVAYELVKYLTTESLEKLFGVVSETEEERLRQTLINMHKDHKTEIYYDIPDIDNRIIYVTFENLFNRVKKRFKKNRTLLKQTLKNCPNLGVLQQIQTIGKNGRTYKILVFIIDSDITEIYGSDP